MDVFPWTVGTFLCNFLWNKATLILVCNTVEERVIAVHRIVILNWVDVVIIRVHEVNISLYLIHWVRCDYWEN